MDTASWILIWKIVFFIGVGLFAVMAILVIIGGAFDIRKMINRLKQQNLKEQDTDH